MIWERGLTVTPCERTSYEWEDTVHQQEERISQNTWTEDTQTIELDGHSAMDDSHERSARKACNHREMKLCSYEPNNPDAHQQV